MLLTLNSFGSSELREKPLRRQIDKFGPKDRLHKIRQKKHQYRTLESTRSPVFLLGRFTFLSFPGKGLLHDGRMGDGIDKGILVFVGVHGSSPSPSRAARLSTSSASCSAMAPLKELSGADSIAVKNATCFGAPF